MKGGKFATYCAPAKIYAIVLSDILGDKLDMIASGRLMQIPQRVKRHYILLRNMI